MTCAKCKQLIKGYGTTLCTLNNKCYHMRCAPKPKKFDSKEFLRLAREVGEFYDYTK